MALFAHIRHLDNGRLDYADTGLYVLLVERVFLPSLVSDRHRGDWS